MLVKPGLLMETHSSSTFTERATQAMGGLSPLYYVDFTTNRAIAGGVDVGAISSIPSISGTLDLSSAGHFVDAADNGIIIPVTGVTYPLTMMVEYIRNTDTGSNEIIARLDDGDATDYVQQIINSSDQARFAVTATTPQAQVNSVATITLGQTYRTAARCNTNSAQMALGGVLSTEATVVTLPANPTRLVVGMDSAGANANFVGYIRELAIVSNITSTDGQLVAAALAA